MRKWHLLHLAQRLLSISILSSWCMSRNKVMFSSGLEESLSRILRSSSFWHHERFNQKRGNWKRTSKVSDFLAVCQFPLIQSSDSNSWDLREFGSSIEEHLGIEWKLKFLNHVKSWTEIDILLPRGSEIEVDKIRHGILGGWLECRPSPGLIGSQICDQVVFLDGRENWCWAMFSIWKRTITKKLSTPTSQSGDFHKIVTQVKMRIVSCLVVCWALFWNSRPRSY